MKTEKMKLQIVSHDEGTAFEAHNFYSGVLEETGLFVKLSCANMPILVYVIDDTSEIIALKKLVDQAAARAAARDMILHLKSSADEKIALDASAPNEPV